MCPFKDKEMLILERHASESVVIDGNIRVTVLQVYGNKVRLGFDAPKDVPIHREEVFERIRAQEQ